MKKNLGQIKSIDLAYQEVKTDYIFHCEDDWLFYRSGFIEDSMTILESDQSILTVWLRDIEKDIEKNYPFHYVFNEKKLIKFHFINQVVKVLIGEGLHLIQLSSVNLIIKNYLDMKDII